MSRSHDSSSNNHDGRSCEDSLPSTEDITEPDTGYRTAEAPNVVRCNSNTCHISATHLRPPSSERTLNGRAMSSLCLVQSLFGDGILRGVYLRESSNEGMQVQKPAHNTLIVAEEPTHISALSFSDSNRAAYRKSMPAMIPIAICSLTPVRPK